MWRLDRFGDTHLPECVSSMDYGTTDASNTVVRTSGGNYDPIGDGYSYLEPLSPTWRGIVTGTASEVADTVAALRAMVSQRDKLYRQMESGEWQWCDARCQNVSVTMRNTDGTMADVAVTWQAEMPWYGHRRGPGWTLDSGETLDSGLYFDESDGLWTVSYTSFKNKLDYNGTYPSDMLTVQIDSGAPVDFDFINLGAVLTGGSPLDWWPHSRISLSGVGTATLNWYIDYHNMRVLVGTGSDLDAYTDAYSSMTYDPAHNQSGFGVIIPVSGGYYNALDIRPAADDGTVYTVKVTWWEAYT